MDKNIKKTIIIVGISVLLITGVYYGTTLYKKYVNSDLLQYEIDSFELDLKPTSIADAISKAARIVASGWTKANVGLLIKNFSPSDFTINTIYCELYATDGTLVAMQNKQLDKPFYIPANKDALLEFGVDIKVAGVMALVKQLKDMGDTPLSVITNVAKNYFTTNKIGAKIKLKGSFTAEGLTMINIPIDSTIDV